MPSPLSLRLARSSGAYSQADKENADRKRKPILEQACARMTKRKRLHLTDICDETEDEGNEDTLVDVDVDTAVKNTAESGQRISSSRSLQAVVIPSEFKAKFDEDVLFGASLLLTFSYAFRP
jgi:hypothetical protein